MNNLYNQSDVKGILKRVEKLTPDAERQWGKMGVAQMLAHCSKVLETAMGRNTPKRMAIGKLLGPLLKPAILSKWPMPRNLPTANKYIMSDGYEFRTEKERAIEHVETFYEDGPENCTQHPNFFFGTLTPEEWATLQWKHWNHHLQQFGV